MSTLTNPRGVFFGCLLATLSLTGCGPGGLAHQNDVVVDRELELPADVRVLRVVVPLGSVTVEPGPEGRVKVDAMLRRMSDTAEGLARLLEMPSEPAIVETDEAGVFDLRVAVEPPELKPDSISNAVILRGSVLVPRDIEIRLRTRRGHLSVIDRSADVNLQTASGDVQLVRVHADAKVFTGLGECTVVDHHGGLDVESKGGSLLAYVRTVGASGIRLDTSGPSIVLHLPEGAGFELDAHVERCAKPRDLLNSFGIPVEASGDGLRAVGTFKDGGPSVSLRVGRGHLSIPQLAKRD